MQRQFCMFDENQMMGPAGEGRRRGPVEREAYGVESGGGTDSWWGVQKGQGSKHGWSPRLGPAGRPGSLAAHPPQPKWDQLSLDWVEEPLSHTLSPPPWGRLRPAGRGQSGSQDHHVQPPSRGHLDMCVWDHFWLTP